MTDRLIEAPSPVAAWMRAASSLLRTPGHVLPNLVVRITNPADVDWKAVAIVDESLGRQRTDQAAVVARTIMPSSVARSQDWERTAQRYERGAIRLNGYVRGSYFHRMCHYPAGGPNQPPGERNQISRTIRGFTNRRNGGSRLVDPRPILLDRGDAEGPGHIGFPCLSLVQFHRMGNVLVATAVYRSHWYHDKALGNFLGLGRLQQLIARECEMEMGELTVVSTKATLDQVTKVREAVRALDKGSP